MNSLELFCRRLQLITVHLANTANTVIYSDHLINLVLADCHQTYDNSSL